MLRARRLPLWWLCATLLLVSAVSRPAPAQTRTLGAATDTLYYISARARDKGRAVARLSDSLEFGLVITTRVTPATGRTEDITPKVLDSAFVTRETFIALLRQRVVSTGGDSSFAVMYTHGYGTSLHDAWQHSIASRARAATTLPWVVFAWPSIGSGVAWPTRGELLTRAYREDSTSAVASHGAYAEALNTVIDAIGSNRVLPMAHSIGGQLIGETLLENVPLRERLTHTPLRALAFVSPDVETTRFTDDYVSGLGSLTYRLVLYASADDRVLAMSSFVNASQRAGRISDGKTGPVVHASLESVDMTEGAYADSPLIYTFGTRHALRRKRAALYDLIHVVGDRREPNCRRVLGTGELLPSGAWRLTPITPPDPATVPGCAEMPMRR